MPNYTIRPGFNIVLNGVLYLGGESVDLNEAEYQANKHKLEGTESNFKTIASPRTSKSSGYPAPYISQVIPPKIITGTTQAVTIEGSFFTPSTKVEIESGSIEKIQFKSDNKLEIVVKSTSTAGSYDLIFDNGKQTARRSAIEFFDIPSGLVDLRLGGTEFTESAIEMRDGMSYSRTPEGMVFSGSVPWRSWARLVGNNDAWVWNRSQKKTLSWIFRNSARCMLGIGSRSTNVRSTQQYSESEIVAYADATRIYNLYGNNGRPSNGVLQNFIADKNSSDIVKAVFTNNGENGGSFSFYKLSSSRLSDWFFYDRKLGEITIEGFGSDEPEIMPFVIPSNGSGSIFLGFILEDE